jgi:hypothetical protein
MSWSKALFLFNRYTLPLLATVTAYRTHNPYYLRWGFTTNVCPCTFIAELSGISKGLTTNVRRFTFLRLAGFPDI